MEFYFLGFLHNLAIFSDVETDFEMQKKNNFVENADFVDKNRIC